MCPRPVASRWPVPTNGCSAWCGGSIRRATAGTPAITTFIRPVARITRIPPKGCGPRTCGRRSSAKGSNVASVLTWGPSYYFQKQFFSGDDHPLSKPGQRLMHYDLEVSGFPSSHAGHLVLLGLKDQDYPGTKRLEDWPTWTLPILQLGEGAGGGRRLCPFRLGPGNAQPDASEL